MMASPLAAASSRATTPEPKTIDDLIAALTNFSRAPTPVQVTTCCCRRDDCGATREWASFRAKLESRLVLSAEVGQALLQRHEAYVRRQDAALSRQASHVFSDVDSDTTQQIEYLTKKLDTVTEENTLMESRITELTVKQELAEASARTLADELRDVRAAHKRLAAQHARSVGWEMKLAQQTQETADMRQERDSQAHRARIAESKAAAFVDKCAKLQNDVQALQEEISNFRASRADFSRTVLHEARSRLEALQRSLGRAEDSTPEDPEMTRVLESLVADNETLKRDTAELQNLLAEAREDVRALREELAEHDTTRVGTPPQSTIYLPRTPVYGRVRGHQPASSVASTSYTLSPQALPLKLRNHGGSFSGNNTRLLADEAVNEWRDEQDLLSPSRPSSVSRHSGERDNDTLPPSPLLSDRFRLGTRSPVPISRSRGVQTDPPHRPALGHPSPHSTTLGVDKDGSAYSDTSSLSQPDARGAVAVLVERVAGQLVRMTQADVRTLTNRLKRQHLLPAGGDARHLSRPTVNAIVGEVAALRPPAGLGNDAVVTRADLKALLKLFKDTFTELGALREQVNDVVFDPAVAHKMRRDAMEGERPPSAVGGWIAPIQKLFASNSPPSLPPVPDPASTNPAPDGARSRTPAARVAPKLAPAIAASTTTVNVEFASSGVRGTDAFDATPAPQGVTGPTALRRPVPLPHSASRNLMGIFAGAPQAFANPPSTAPAGEQWVVLPRGDRDRVRPSLTARLPTSRGNTATLGRRAAASVNSSQLSRNVDAVIDQQERDAPAPDFRTTLLERTLRPRGLSDSSIHTSFLKSEVLDSPPEKGSGAASPQISVPSSPPRTSARLPPSLDREGARSPAARLGRHLASWATAATGRSFNEGAQGDAEIAFGSPREEGGMHHAAWARRGLEGRNI